MSSSRKGGVNRRAQAQSQASSARNVINALRQRHQQAKNPKLLCRNWCVPANFTERLSDIVTFANIMDAISYIISSASEAANDYISSGVPAIVNAISGIGPTLVPFLPNILCLCQQHADPVNTSLEEYRAEVDELFAETILSINALEEEARTQLTTNINKIKREFIDKFIADQVNTRTGCVDNIINVIYLVLRAVGGVLIMIKGVSDLKDDGLDEDSNDLLEDIGKWIMVGSTAAYLIYYVSSLLPKWISHCYQPRTSESESNINESDDEKSSETVNRLTSVTVVNSPQVLFRSRRAASPSIQSIAPQTQAVVSSAASLTQPLLKNTMSS